MIDLAGGVGNIRGGVNTAHSNENRRDHAKLVHHAIFVSRTRFDDDRRMLQRAALFDVDGVAACLAQSASDTAIRQHGGGKEATAGDRAAVASDEGVNLHELNRAITSRNTFVDAQLTCCLDPPAAGRSTG